MNKKAQVTVFIILGIVLLFSSAFVFYIKEQVTESKPAIGLVEDVPLEIQPVQMFVTDCLKRTAVEGLNKAGLQGGYIDTSQLKILPNPTESEGVEFSPGGIRVPYWHYMSGRNDCEGNCQLGSKLLPLKGELGKTVETELGTYVDERLELCANLASFEDQGFEIRTGDSKTKVIVGANDVHFQTEYPITLTKAGVVSEMSSFYTKVDVSLSKFYDLARDITENELETSFLEFQLINLISSYARPDETKLPPIAHTGFSSSPVYWVKKNVEDKLKEILSMYVPALQTSNTLNFKGNLYTGESSLGEGIYSNFIVPIGRDYPLESSFIYLDWPIYFDISPMDGALIKPTEISVPLVSSLLPIPPLQKYQFLYDVSYPVVIELYDPNAMEGDGFTFQFALETNLRNNAPFNTSAVKVRSMGGSTMVCDSDKRNSGEVTVTVTDSITGEPIPEVAVYSSFGAETCLIGYTKLENGTAVLKSNMPVGIGAIVVSKSGYVTSVQRHGTKVGRDDSLSFVMHPIIEKNITVSKKQVIKQMNGNFLFNPTARPLSATDGVILTLTRLKQIEAETNVVESVEIIGNQSGATMRLAPGTYEVDASLITHERTVIPQDEVCYKDDWYDSIGLGDEECQTIQEVVFDESFPHGGLILDSRSGYFVIPPQALVDSKQIEFYVIEAPAGYIRNPLGVTNLKHEDLEEINNIEEYSRQNRGHLEPRFINE
ncbi:hypothetical protein ACFLZ7_01175 [Nanoarchaeota archaeon]